MTVSTGLSKLEIDLLIDEGEGKVTAVLAYENGLNEIIQITGYSSTHPDDKFVEDIGLELAVGRALVKTGKAMIREANKEVHRIDRFNKSQKEASERAVQERKIRSEEVKANLHVNKTFKVGDRVKVVKNLLIADSKHYVGEYGIVVEAPKFASWVQVKLDNYTSKKGFMTEELQIVDTVKEIREGLPA